MRIVHVVGTRPNFVKMAPVIAAARARFGPAANMIVHTGQHYDATMSDVFFAELGVPEPDHMLGVGSGSHAEQTATVIERLVPVLRGERPDLVIVPGDVNSTLAATLAAHSLEIPVGHVESGLRSFDRSMPEEVNRIVTDHLSALLFGHSPEAEDNLRAEGLDDRFEFVGNTMIDTLIALEERFRARGAAAGVGVAAGDYLLVTLHRPALVDGPLLAEALSALGAVAAELPVVFPIHPRTRKMLAAAVPDGIRLIEPVGYLDFLSLEADAAAVLTDSGGIQEETTYLGVPCFTLRDNTERPVTVRAGTNTLLGLDPARIREIPELLLRARPARNRDTPGREAEEVARPDLWDGEAASRITRVLADWYLRA